MADSTTDQISAAFAKAIVDVVQAVAGAAGASVGVNQQTAGALGGIGGNVVEAGQGSQSTVTEAQAKVDVSGPELIESYNVSMLQDIAQMGKSNAKLYDAGATAISLATLGSGANMYQQQINQTGHADEEFSARKRATVISLVTVGDAVEEGADDSDK